MGNQLRKQNIEIIMMKLLVIFGTRPEAIKLAPVIHAARLDARFDVQVCVTGQHREMLDQMLALFDIKPDYDLDIMLSNQHVLDMTSRILSGLKSVLFRAQPDYIIVQGDTTSAFMGALAGFYFKIPVGHVEAGLRTHDLYSPFPEEANRTLITRLAHHHFAPTKKAYDNLVRENIAVDCITVTGNTVIDALLWVCKKNKLKTDWSDVFGSIYKVLQPKKPIILVTGHRRESFGQGFLNICKALATIAENHPDWHIIYPVHLNPHVQEPVRGMLDKYDNVHLLAPLEYAPFVYLMQQAHLILTDSGGIQEEAPALGKPVLVMRDVTERPEAIEAGTAILVGTDAARIIAEVEDLMHNAARYEAMARINNPFGDGCSARRILDKILETSDE